jgi:hypothetical protein
MGRGAEGRHQRKRPRQRRQSSSAPPMTCSSPPESHPRQGTRPRQHVSKARGEVHRAYKAADQTQAAAGSELATAAASLEAASNL